MNQARLLAEVFFAPYRAFVRILQRPKSSLAVFVLVVCSLAVHISVHSRIDMAAQVRLSAAELSAQEPGTKLSDHDVNEKAQRAMNARRIGGYVLCVFGVPAAVAALALLIWLFFGAWSSQLGFKRCYRLAAHVALPFGLRQLLSIIVIMTYPSIDPTHTWGLFKTNLGALMPNSSLPGLFLLDPFWIWMGVLAGLAGRAMGRGRIWSVIVAIILWFLLAFLGRSF